MRRQIPVVDGLFASGRQGPRLIGTRCAGCGHFYFPAADCRNPECSDRRVERAELSARGKLWSYTIQHYPPPPPFRTDAFKPFAIGLVELPEGLKVLGIMAEENYERLRIGSEVELVLQPMYRNEADEDVVTWMFRLVGSDPK